VAWTGLGGSFIRHMAGNIDWAVVINGSRTEPGQLGQIDDAFKTITELPGQVDAWPKGDLFPRLD
jgi:hypothetical protein